MVMESTGALATLGTVITQIISWVSDMVTTISSNPLLLISLGIFVLGAIIGLAKRLMGN